MRDELEAHAAAWIHRANNVETHGGVQSALLACAADVRRVLERHADTDRAPPMDEEPERLPPP